ncbi:hypothetical protein LMG19083_00608 [Ralstonia psammae]|uniref:Uncharacterized protein n=1 Tax=Ralstonia psammae TaxID=3058598 RepID=A0ABM9J263_9RALS|nr:hypothetical protein [Ralstonia sp. LMG 19083]CAJ0780005.1 hypothetical protein LMG19083_00608 [Ralstonia sp. LMG 19083]
MTFADNPYWHVAPSQPVQPSPFGAKTAKQKPHSAYALLQQMPVAALAGNVMERPDVSGIAILGYN